MGSALLPPDLHGVDEEAWGALLARIVDSLAVPTTPITADIETAPSTPTGRTP
jgi:hypothetical protein